MVIEPRMTGLLLIDQPPTQDHRRIQWDLDPQPGLAGSFEFWDRRGLGTVRLLNKSEMIELHDRLGPDPLTMTSLQWAVQLARTQRPIKNVLLDQNLVVGIDHLNLGKFLEERAQQRRIRFVDVL